MSAFALVIRPADFSIYLLPLTQRSPTQQLFTDAAASVLYFSPVTSSAQADSTSELLRFL